MARRSRFWVYRFLVLRDGEKCGKKDSTCKGKLIIDHINGNESDERPENLRLLCKSHNEREAPLNEREREKIYSEGSPEMKVNIESETHYRKWVMVSLLARDFITKDEAINAGAEICEVSPTTTRKYLAKLSSTLGPLKEVKDKERGRIIQFKEVGEIRE